MPSVPITDEVASAISAAPTTCAPSAHRVRRDSERARLCANAWLTRTSQIAGANMMIIDSWISASTTLSAAAT